MTSSLRTFSNAGLPETAIRTQPELVQAYSNLAGALKATGEVDEAVRQYREAVRVDPNCAEAYYDLAIALAISTPSFNPPISTISAIYSKRKACCPRPPKHSKS